MSTHTFGLHAGKYMQFLTAQKCLKTIQKLPCYTHMVLQPFNMQEVRQYMCIGLDLEVVSDQTALAIQERTGGLPLYVEQVGAPTTCTYTTNNPVKLVIMMTDYGTVDVDDADNGDDHGHVFVLQAWFGCRQCCTYSSMTIC